MSNNKSSSEVLNTIIQLIEILNDIDSVDTLGQTISIKAKIIGKIDDLLDEL
jgi:hypothetical protein